MSEQPTPGPAGAGEPQSVEDKLGSFDFDTPAAAPAGEPQAKPEPGDDAALETLAGEEGSPPTAPDDDDLEVNLRDNRKVKLSELKRNYRPDYEKQVATWRQQQQAIAQRAASFAQQEQAYAQLLQNAVNFVAAKMPQAPDTKLIDSDPFEYQRQKANYDAEEAKLTNLAQQQQAYQQHLQAKQRQEFNQRLSREREAVHQVLPKLKDPVEAAKFHKDALEYLSSHRFTKAEAGQIYDHRIMAVLADALEGRRLKASLEKVKAKLKEAQTPPPPVQEPSRRRSPADVRNETLRGQLAKLQKSGAPKDAEAILSKFN